MGCLGEPTGWRRVGACLGALVLIASSCSDEPDGQSGQDRVGGQGSSEETDAGSGGPPAANDPDDDRDDVLAELGPPDAFILQVGEIDDGSARFESWTYFAASTQIDFLDGEVLWDIEIDPVDEGALLPILYSPAEFDLLASKDDTTAILDGIQLSEIDGSELEIEGAELLAGEQILLAFVDDQLVYVETYVLAPGDQEVE